MTRPILIVSLLGPFAFGLIAHAAAEVPKTAPKAPVVLVETAKSVELADTITYPARVTSRVRSTIYAPTDGYVAKIRTPLGAVVSRDAKLMEIKNIDPVYEYVAVPVDTPVAGVVSSVEVTEGTRVTKGQALATVTDPKQLELIVEVPAADLTAMRPGLTGEFTLTALSDTAKAMPVKVLGVSPLVDPATGTATAEISLITPNPAVPLGTLGKVTFALNRRQGIQIPEQAISYRGKETLVRLVVDGKAKLQPITVAETRKGLVEVASGLATGAVVIVRASGFVADGQEVVIDHGDMATK